MQSILHIQIIIILDSVYSFPFALALVKVHWLLIERRLRQICVNAYIYPGAPIIFINLFLPFVSVLCRNSVFDVFPFFCCPFCLKTSKSLLFSVFLIFPFLYSLAAHSCSGNKAMDISIIDKASRLVDSRGQPFFPCMEYKELHVLHAPI